MDSKNKSNLWKKSESLFANSAPVFLSLAAVCGAATLAMFEYFGLVTDSMNSWYKFGLGLGVTVICIAYLYIARGKWYSAIPLSIIFGLYIFGGSFSGRSAVTTETEKQAQHAITQNVNANNLVAQFGTALESVNEHQTIKHNNQLFSDALEAVKLQQNQDAPPLTINERRGDAVALLSRMNIHITAHEYEMLLTALFTLCLFIGTGTLSRAANARKLSGNSWEGREPQGDQEVTNPDSGSQETKTKFTDEEIERAFDWDIASNERKDYTNKLGHDAIKAFYKTESSAGNSRVAELVKKKKSELKEMRKQNGSTSRFGWKVLRGGKK